MAGDAQLGIGLVGIGQPQHRHRHPGLADRPRGGELRCPVAEKHRMEALMFGRRRDVSPCFGKHAEPTSEHSTGWRRSSPAEDATRPPTSSSPPEQASRTP